MRKVKYSRRHFCTREKNIKKLKKNKLLKKNSDSKIKKKKLNLKPCKKLRGAKMSLRA